MATIEDRIRRWSEQKRGTEDEPAAVLLCDAEDELRRLRAEREGILDWLEREAEEHEAYPCEMNTSRAGAFRTAAVYIRARGESTEGE